MNQKNIFNLFLPILMLMQLTIMNNVQAAARQYGTALGRLGHGILNPARVPQRSCPSNIRPLYMQAPRKMPAFYEVSGVVQPMAQGREEQGRTYMPFGERSELFRQTKSEAWRREQGIARSHDNDQQVPKVQEADVESTLRDRQERLRFEFENLKTRLESVEYLLELAQKEAQQSVGWLGRLMIRFGAEPVEQKIVRLQEAKADMQRALDHYQLEDQNLITLIKNVRTIVNERNEVLASLPNQMRNQLQILLNDLKDHGDISRFSQEYTDLYMTYKTDDPIVTEIFNQAWSAIDGEEQLRELASAFREDKPSRLLEDLW